PASGRNSHRGRGPWTGDSAGGPAPRLRGVRAAPRRAAGRDRPRPPHLPKLRQAPRRPARGGLRPRPRQHVPARAPDPRTGGRRRGTHLIPPAALSFAGRTPTPGEGRHGRPRTVALIAAASGSAHHARAAARLLDADAAPTPASGSA